MEKKQSKKIILGVAIFAVIVAMFVAVYYFTRPETSKGAKAVEITVVDKEGKETTYNIDTDAEYLETVMEEAKEKGLTYSGTESDFGLMIDTVNGQKASFEEDGAYWGFSVNGEYCNYGISEQPVTDGDEFEVKYTIQQ